METELLTVEDVAKRWKLKTSWVYQHIHELPHFNLGTLVRFDPEQLKQYLQSKQEGPGRNGRKDTEGKS